MSKMAELVKGILAGTLITMGCVINLSMENRILGAMLFSIGLFVILSLGLNLYTGKVGFLASNPTQSNITIVGLSLVGNMLGAGIAGALLSVTSIYTLIQPKAQSIVELKFQGDQVSIFVLAMFCGMLMYIAARVYKTCSDSMTKNMVVFLCVVVFILSGYSHSVAAMGYIAIANTLVGDTVLSLITMIIGNAVGAFAFDAALNICTKND